MGTADLSVHASDESSRSATPGRGRRLGKKVAFAGFALAMLSPVAIAVADSNLPDVPRHRHFVVSPSGKMTEVGPRLCDDPSLQAAFNQYHNNAHHSFCVPADDVQGPAAGAPGLHNGKGAELTARGC